MKFIKILALIPLLVFSHAEDMYLIKGGITFLPDGSFAKKDILVDAVSYTHLTLPTITEV